MLVHIGGHKYFPIFYSNSYEAQWLDNKFPLPISLIKQMISLDCKLPDGYNLNEYTLFQGKPSRILQDNDIIDLGDRSIQVIHTPGHSPGHICFWENEKGYLFCGDIVYQGKIYINYPSTNPNDYIRSIKRISNLPIKKLYPGHHSLNITPPYNR